MRFNAHDLQGVVSSMDKLAAAGDGWVNLLPGLAENETRSSSLGFLTLFSGGSIGVTMCTWIPAGDGERTDRRASLGITHITARRVVARLEALGLPVPAGWLVEQDHPRRGLVLRLPAGEPAEGVLAWAMAAVEALIAPRPIMNWDADVYLPLES